MEAGLVWGAMVAGSSEGPLVECKEWEGSLESLVKFLYAVHAEGAMLDVRKLFIRPGSSAAGKAATGLRGSFTLFCAYLRSDSNPNPERDNR